MISQAHVHTKSDFFRLEEKKSIYQLEISSAPNSKFNRCQSMSRNSTPSRSCHQLSLSARSQADFFLERCAAALYSHRISNY